MKKTILAVLCLFALAPPLQAQEGTTTKEQDIRRLLDLTGSAKLAEQIMDQLTTTLGEDGADQAFWESFRAEVDIQELVRMTIPIYDKHFTQAEIRELIAFYQTPLGAKVVEKMPAIAQESMVAGMEWGEEIVEKAMARLEARKEKKEEQP